MVSSERIKKRTLNATGDKIFYRKRALMLSPDSGILRFFGFASPALFGLIIDSPSLEFYDSREQKTCFCLTRRMNDLFVRRGS
jgi:hypothetical protein